MPERDFLADVALVVAASFPVLFLCRRLALPQIVGYLFTGIVLGPHALGLLRDPHRVERIADLGVVLILFFVGLQFPLEKLVHLGRSALVGGAVQMGLTVAAVAAGHQAALALRGAASPPALGTSLFFGCLAALSSTAVVLPILAARDEMATPYARRFLGVSLFQDLAVIPLVLLLPALAPRGAAAAGGAGAPSLAAVAGRVALALVGVAALVALARFVVPRLLAGAARLGSRESFTGAVVVIVLSIVALAERTGVSAALGAFAAGIVLGESEHVHEVTAALAPFRDLLSSLFFASIGMLLNPRFLAASPLLVGAAVAAVLLVKALAAYGALRLANAAPKTALRAALALATIGEFSFVLAGAGARLGLLSEGAQQLFVASSVVTLALAPLLVALGPRAAALLPERVEESAEPDPHGAAAPSRHVVVVGYGLNGRNVCRALKETRLPVVLLEGDAERVALARKDGVRALRGDATSTAALDAAGVPNAHAVVVAIADPDGARRIVRLCRMRNPGARILVRTRYVAEVEALRRLGASEVIPEEFETSIEIVARVLRLFHVPGNVVATQLRLLRDETYLSLRDPEKKVSDGRRLSALVAAGTTELFLVMPESAADGRTLADLRLEDDHVAVPALLRDGKPLAPPPLDAPLVPGDTLLLVGAHEDLLRAAARLETRLEERDSGASAAS